MFIAVSLLDSKSSDVFKRVYQLIEYLIEEIQYEKTLSPENIVVAQINKNTSRIEAKFQVFETPLGNLGLRRLKGNPRMLQLEKEEDE